MFKLAVSSLRFRAAASLATVLAVLLGCAILVICGGIFETAFRLNAPPTRLAGAPLLVTHATGYRLGDTPEVIPYTERTHVPANINTTLQKVDGVQQVIPDVTFSAVLSDHAGITNSGQFGHNWQSAALTPYQLTDGHAPKKGQVVINDALGQQTGQKLGDRMRIAVDSQTQTFEISGIVRADHHVATPSLFFNDAEAATFAPQKQQVNAFGIIPAHDVSLPELSKRISNVLPSDTAILTGDDRGMVEYSGVAGSRLPLLLLGGVFSGMVMVVMALIISATIGLTTRQRQQELALLRASGATPRKVRRMVVIETMLVSVVAVGAGVWLGNETCAWFFSTVAQRGLVSPAIIFQHGFIPLLSSAFITLLITWITATISAGSAAKVQPIQAMVEASLPSNTVGTVRRWLAMIFGLATVGLAGATVFMDAETASAVGGPAVLTGSIAVGLFAPDLLSRIVSLLPKQRSQNGMRVLAIKNVQSRAAQFAGVLTPLTLAVAIALGNIYSQTSQQHAALQNYIKQFAVDAVVTSDTGGLNTTDIRVIQQKSAVLISPLITSQGWIEKPYDTSHTSDPNRLLGINAQDDTHSMIATPVVAGSLSKLHGNSVALPQKQAHDLKLDIGSSITLRLGDGSQIKVMVVALLDAPADYASILLPADTLMPHTSNDRASYALIKARDDTAKRQIVPQLQKELASTSNLHVGSNHVLANNMAADVSVQAWINYLVAGLAVAYAAIATINALVVIISGRRQELAMQRLLGATSRQLVRMMLFESLVVSSIAFGLGCVVAICTIEPMAVASGLLLPAGSPLILAGVIVAILLMVLPTTYVVTHMITKRRALDM